MYFAFERVKQSLTHFERLHPFFGQSFLVGKLGGLPVGRSKSFPYDRKDKEFLDKYYKPDVASKRPYQPFRTANPQKRWLSPKYASSGAQSTRTKSDLAKAFIHKKDTHKWGWRPNYIRVLKDKLERDKSGKIPAFWLAIWIFRDKKWPPQTTPESVVDSFFKQFHITKAEREALFEASVPAGSSEGLFTEEPYSDAKLLKVLGPAPDARPEEGGVLNFLELEGVGPGRKLTLSPGSRLSIITGDNGLGKTFLLECAWWALTGHWAETGRPALARLDAKRSEPKITFEISGRETASKRTVVAFDWDTQNWPVPKRRPTIPGIVVYARVDGSFAIWDPIRNLQFASQYGSNEQGGLFVVSRDEALNGLGRKIEGLLRDWVKWQTNPDTTLFDTFRQVLRRLSPPDIGPLEPGKPIRLPHDAREIPTISHRYGDVPFIHESAGVKRIATIGYLLVWTWNEHKISSSLAKKPPQQNMVVLIDEMEAHLHPKWQRMILPALLDVTTILSREIKAQMIVATHSPLVLASIETNFSDENDKLFHLELSDAGKVSFKELPFVRYGRVDAWLTSDLFQLKQARSPDGEVAIERAKALLEKGEGTPAEIRVATSELKKALSADDEFWPRWMYFAEKKGL